MKSADVRKVFVMAVVLASLVSIFVPVACADPGSQKWFLVGDTTLSKTFSGDGGTVILSGESNTWTVESAAECDLSIGAGTWVADIHHDTGPSHTETGTITVEIYKVGDSTPLATKSESITGAGEKVINCVMSEGKDFNVDDRFSVKISWSSGEGMLMILHDDDPDDKRSTLSSPSSDPGWPVPELSTLVLFSVGLLAVVGYVMYSRRRNN